MLVALMMLTKETHMEEIMDKDVKEVPEVARPVEEPVAEQLPDPAPAQQGISLNDLRHGYLVGLTDDGNFVFELLGKEKELVPLLGLHRYAGERVQLEYNKTQMAGDVLTHEVGKAVNNLNQKIDALGSLLTQLNNARTPDNKLV